MERGVLLLLLSVLGCCLCDVLVSVDWSTAVTQTQTTPTLQLVVNPLIRRGSGIHDAVFEGLKNLQASYARFVPWLPYPKLAVAELEPPSGNPQCMDVINLQKLYLSCPLGVINNIVFASYGTPTGRCGNFKIGSCHAKNSSDIVRNLCLNKQSCTISADTPTFGDPCYGIVKHLAVQATCSIAVNTTSWDFSLIDPMMEDYINAIHPTPQDQSRPVIINFSTIPQWMFVTDGPVSYPNDPNQVFWSYEAGTELRDPSLVELGDYYRRLVSWYTKGGFVDEYGQTHQSGHYYNISHWEVLNEVDSEHSSTPQQYTQIYDAIVTAIKSVNPKMKFVGLALANHNEYNWYEYFLNNSNHDPRALPLDFISFHFYASAATRTQPKDYEAFFPQADGFFQEVSRIQILKNQINPSVAITIDEIGVILPNDNNLDAEQFPLVYWNAAGALFAYIYCNLSLQHVEVLGESQLVGYPSQFPSVSMVNWTSGELTARYWVLKLLIKYFDGKTTTMIKTTVNSPTIHAQAFLDPTKTRHIILINKLSTSQTATFNNVVGATVEFIDETTGFGPPGKSSLKSNSLALLPFGVYILTLPTSTVRYN